MRVVGISAGGMTLLHVASRHPARIEALAERPATAVAPPESVLARFVGEYRNVADPFERLPFVVRAGALAYEYEGAHYPVVPVGPRTFTSSSALPRLPARSPSPPPRSSRLVDDEAFWARVRAGYSLDPEVLNLDHGWTNPAPRAACVRCTRTCDRAWRARSRRRASTPAPIQR